MDVRLVLPLEILILTSRDCSVGCVYSNCFVLPLYDYCIPTYSAVEEIWNVIVHCFSQAIQNRLGQVRMITNCCLNISNMLFQKPARRLMEILGVSIYNINAYFSVDV